MPKIVYAINNAAVYKAKKNIHFICGDVLNPDFLKNYNVRSHSPPFFRRLLFFL